MIRSCALALVAVLVQGSTAGQPTMTLDSSAPLSWRSAKAEDYAQLNIPPVAAFIAYFFMAFMAFIAFMAFMAFFMAFMAFMAFLRFMTGSSAFIAFLRFMAFFMASH